MHIMKHEAEVEAVVEVVMDEAKMEGGETTAEESGRGLNMIRENSMLTEEGEKDMED